MKFKILGSKRVVSKNLDKFRIDWDHAVRRGSKGQFGKFQFNVKKLLRPYWEKHIVYEEVPVVAKAGERGKSVDLMNLTTRQIIEVQGKAHGEYVPGFFHKNRFDYLKQMQRDQFKKDWAELNDFEFFEIMEEDELNDELLEKLGII